MEYFRDEKGRLVTQKQYERALNRLSPVRRLLNQFIYDSNMGYTESKIWHALKKGQAVCYLEYPNATEEELKDIVARLKYMGYNVEFYFFGTHIDSEIRVRLDNSEEGIDYV